MSVQRRWNYASEPARQLNSIAIKNSARCYIAPIVQRGLAVFTVKCVWRVAGGQDGLYKAWDMISEKRNECDTSVADIPNVVFFFSAISVFDDKNKKSASEDNVETVESEQSLLSETNSSQSTTVYESAVRKKRYPAISYWIAVTSKNGAPVRDLSLRKALLKCNVEIDAKTVSCRRGSEEKCIRALFTVLKDHSSSYMQELVNESCQRCFEQTYVDVTDDEPTTSQVSEIVTIEKVVRFTMVSKASKQIETALKSLRRSGLELDIAGMPAEIVAEEEACLTSEITTDPCVILIHDIEKIMKKLNFALYKGEVYKLIPGAKFTYQLKCDVEKFIGTLEGNAVLKAKIIKYGKRVVNILSNRDSQAIRQIRVDYNLIEISDGRCLSLKDREITSNAIPEAEIGMITPRAFSAYDGAMQNCDAKFFQEVLENSLSSEEISSFCEDFLRLLHHRGKTHKEKVPFLIGEPNSGKTSLFSPIQGIVHPKRIAKITKQREFNKAMINDDCEVIFLDEAHVKMMDLDDWKILTQGGWTAHDAKFKTCQGFVNKCPMLIASQTDMDFGSTVDNDAMDTRLRRYKFKKLPSPEPDAFTWLKKHPVECIIWAMNNAGGNARDSHVQHENGTDGEDANEKLTCAEEQELFELNVRSIIESDDADSEYEEAFEDDAAGPSQEATSDSIGSSAQASSQRAVVDVETRVQGELEKCHETSLRFKHLSGIKNKLLREKQKRLCEYKERMVKQKLLTAEECEQFDDQETIPEALKKKIHERRWKIIREDNAKRKQNIEEEMEAAFANPWLHKTERDLIENQEKFEKTDPALYKSLCEIGVHKLWLYHSSKKYDVKSKVAIAKRAKMLKDFGYNASVTDLWSVPLLFDRSTSSHPHSESEPEDGLSGLTQPDPPRKSSQQRVSQQRIPPPAFNKNKTHSHPITKDILSQPTLVRTWKTANNDEDNRDRLFTRSQPVPKRKKLCKTVNQSKIEDFFRPK